MSRVAAMAAVVAIVAAGCGDSTGSADTGPAPTETAAVGTAPVGPGPTSSTSAPAPPSTGPAPTPTEATSTTTTEPPPPLAGIGLETVARDLDEPVFAISPPGDPRLFVVEQAGRILIVEDGVVADEPFLNIADDVESSSLEQGLLGLAFHPAYPDNGRFFVYYIDNGGDTRLSQFSVGDDPDRADPDSEQVLLEVDQPAGNHNGGMIEFGPDGYLYVGLGDGGGANDRFGNGQRADTVLGTILRLDIDAARPYAIPPDNPFVAGGGAPEVWAYGLRNPWRFAIDPAGGHLYIGDVGQGAREEIDVAPISQPGLNYGWPILEGSLCFQDPGCSTEGLVLPAVEYGRDDGCSVIGGFVYRGAEMPELDGHYFYSDWCGGWLRSFRYAEGAAGDARDWTSDVGLLGSVTSFGMDGAGELYVLTGEGFLLKITPVR